MAPREKLELSSGGSSLMSILPSELTPLEIFKAAKKEDPVALQVVDFVCDDLGYALSHIINILDIETIFLTGGISRGC